MEAIFVSKLDCDWELKFKSKSFIENETMYAIQIQNVFYLLCEMNYSSSQKEPLDYSNIFEMFEDIFKINLNKNCDILKNIHLIYKEQTKCCKKLFRSEIAKLTSMNLDLRQYDNERKKIVGFVLKDLREKFDRISHQNRDIANEYENQLMNEINVNIDSEQDLNNLCVGYLFKKLEKCLEKEISLVYNDQDKFNHLEKAAVDLIMNINVNQLNTNCNWKDIQEQALKLANIYFKIKFSKNENIMSKLNYQSPWFFRELYEDFIEVTIDKYHRNGVLEQDLIIVDQCAQNFAKHFFKPNNLKESESLVKLDMSNKLKEKWPVLKNIIQLVIDFNLMLAQNVTHFDAKKFYKDSEFIDLNSKWVIERVKYFNPLEFCIVFKILSKNLLKSIQNPTVLRQLSSNQILKIEEKYLQTEENQQGHASGLDLPQDLLITIKNMIKSINNEKMNYVNAKIILQTLISEMFNEDNSIEGTNSLNKQEMKIKLIEGLKIYLDELNNSFKKGNESISQNIIGEMKPQIKDSQFSAGNISDETFEVIESTTVPSQKSINIEKYITIQNCIYLINYDINSRQYYTLSNIMESSLEMEKIKSNIFISTNSKNYLIYFFNEVTNINKIKTIGNSEAFAKLLNRKQYEKLVPSIKNYSFDFLNLCGRNNLSEKEINNYPLKKSETGFYLKFNQILRLLGDFLIETILSMQIYYCINEISKDTQNLWSKALVILLPHNSTITKKNCIRSIRHVLNLNSMGILSEITATGLAYYFEGYEAIINGQNIAIIYLSEEHMEIVFAELRKNYIKLFSGPFCLPFKIQSRWSFSSINIVDEIDEIIKRETIGKSVSTLVLSGQSERKDDLLNKINKKFSKFTIKDYSNYTILSAAQTYIKQMKTLRIFELPQINIKCQIGLSPEYELLFEGIDSLPINSIIESKTINVEIQCQPVEIKIFEQDELIKIFKLKNLTEKQMIVNLKVLFKFNIFSKILIDLHFEDYDKCGPISISEKEYSPSQKLIINEREKISKISVFLT